jgi:hypothetical protein
VGSCRDSNASYQFLSGQIYPIIWRTVKKTDLISATKTDLNADLSSLRSPIKLETIRQREIFSYLCENDGVDQAYKAHPRKATVLYQDLMPALHAAQELGYCRDLKPYHIQRVKNLWSEQSWLDEIILKKVNLLLQEKYDNKYLRFCAQVQAKDLLKPIVDVINGRPYRISVLQPLGTYYNSSPAQIAERYLEITGQKDKYKELRPYHFSSASQGTYHKDGVAYEVVRKKITSLLSELYQGDFANLCAHVNQAQFMTPFIDHVATEAMLVKMGVAAQAFDDCLYSMLSTYIKNEHLEKEFTGFRPYHMSTASQATYKNPCYVTEVVVKSCKYQIATEFQGDESAFLNYGTIPQICRPFYEKIAGSFFSVSSDTAIKIFGESSKKIKALYLRERDNIQLL